MSFDLGNPPNKFAKNRCLSQFLSAWAIAIASSAVLWALGSTVAMGSSASTRGTPGTGMPGRAAMERSDSDADSDSDAEVERSWTMKPKPAKPWIYERVRAYSAEEWAQRFGSNSGHLNKSVWPWT